MNSKTYTEIIEKCEELKVQLTEDKEFFSHYEKLIEQTNSLIEWAKMKLGE